GINPAQMTEVNHRGADQSGVRTRAGRHHGPGCLSTGNQRQRNRIGLPGTMLQIDVVNPDPPVTHDHLARRRHRVRALDQNELFGPAMTRDLDCEQTWPLPSGAATLEPLVTPTLTPLGRSHSYLESRMGTARSRTGCRIRLPYGIGPRDYYTAGQSTPHAACRGAGLAGTWPAGAYPGQARGIDMHLFEC